MPGPYRCIRLITRAWENRLYRLPPKKDYHVYIARSTYHYAYARQTQVNWKKETKNKEEKGKEMGAWGQEKEKVNKFWGVYWRVLPPARCHVVFRRSTAVLRTTSDTPTEARTTGQLRDRQLAVVVTCLCVGGPCPASCWLLRVMRVRLNLPTSLVLHFELSAVVLVATSCCCMC